MSSIMRTVAVTILLVGVASKLFSGTIERIVSQISPGNCLKGSNSSYYQLCFLYLLAQQIFSKQL